MNKKMIAAATLAALASPAAWAESGNVTIYGAINASFDVIDNGTSPAKTGTTTNKVSSDASRIGFKGTEDIGGGLKALWQIESQIDIDNSATAGTFATRNTFVGLSDGTFGTLLLGRYDTPYKVSTRRLDMFPDSIADNRTLMGSVKGISSSTLMNFDQRPTDTVAWTSPSWSGFTASASYIAAAESASASTDQKGDAWSLAAWYDVAPLYVTLAYETHKLGSAGTGVLAGGAVTAPTVFQHTGASESAWKLGLGYKVGAFDFSAAYEKTTDNLGGTGAPAFLGAPALVAGADVFGHDSYYLAGKYTISSDVVKVAYTHAGDLDGAAAGKDTSAKHESIGYDHGLSKRTTLFALYTRLDNGKDVAYGLGGAGWTSGNTAAAGAGAAVSAWSFGVKHAF